MGKHGGRGPRNGWPGDPGKRMRGGDQSTEKCEKRIRNECIVGPMSLKLRFEFRKQ